MKLVAVETTDHELVAHVRAGDDRAFEELYRRYHRRIAAYVQGMVKDHARAEDVTQDVFMSALRRMRDTDRPIAFKPWIYEIAKNACIDQFRRSKRAEEVSYDAEDGLQSGDYGKLVTKEPAPERAFESKQQLDHLRGAFGGLSETHHQILVMRELEGLSYREIGERLGMTRPAVESTLFRARRRLTEEYEDLVTGERCQRVQGIIATAVSGGPALGARDRKRLAKHVSYCQPCLRHARVSGLDARDLTRTPVRTKIAALLPLPAFLKRKLLGAEAAAGPSPDVSSSMAVWSAHASTVDPGVVTGWGKAAMGAATIALAGVGAGVATSPPDSARAGGGSIIERVQDRGESGDRHTAFVAAPPAAPAGTTAGAAGPGSGTGSSGSSSRDRSGSSSKRETVASTKGGGAKVVAGSTSPASAGAGSGAGASGPGTLAPGGAPASDGSSSSPSSSSSDSGTSGGGGSKSSAPAPAPAKKDPVSQVVQGVTGAVTGGGSGSGSGSGPGSGSSGGGTQQPAPTQPAQPVIRLPLPEAPPAPEGAPSGGVVGEVVEGVGGAVGGVVDGLNRTVEGVTGILAPK